MSFDQLLLVLGVSAVYLVLALGWTWQHSKAHRVMDRKIARWVRSNQ